MKFVIPVVGFLVGLLFGFSVALLGLVLGIIVVVILGERKEAAVRQDLPVEGLPPLRPSVEDRVVALEREVQALRARVDALSANAHAPARAASVSVQAKAVVPAALAPTPQPAPRPAPPVVVPPQPQAGVLFKDTVPDGLAHSVVVAPSGKPTSAPSTTPVTATTSPKPVASRPAPPRPAPAPEPEPATPTWLQELIFGGNTIVKVGVLILFLGLAFLLRYTAERVSVPVEFRYMGVALIGAVLLSLGWRLRDRPDQNDGPSGYGLILQGAGIGVFYLTALAAIKLHGLLPASWGFGFMALVAVLGAVLAVAQNAQALALVAVLEGFAAPVLISTGQGNHVALFTYMAILDVGIFLMAWSRAWRWLNLVGAISTFSLASLWAQKHYVDALYGSTQAFLWLFFVLFAGVSVLFARRALALGDPPDARSPLAQRAYQALSQVGRVDSTLTFGVPLAAFGLQYLLVQDVAFGSAWAALGFALFYGALACGLLMGGQRRYALLSEAYAIVGVIFGTVAIPLALEGGGDGTGGQWTGATWAIEAAGMYWLGMRQQRAYARGLACLVMGGGLLKLLLSMGVDHGVATPLLTGSLLGLGLALISLCAMQAAYRLWPEQEHPAWERVVSDTLPWLTCAVATAMVWVSLVPLWAAVLTAWLALVCRAVSAYFEVPRFRWAPVCLHTLALVGWLSNMHHVHGQAMLADGWRGLSATVLIGVALLLTAVVELAQYLRAAPESRRGAPDWSIYNGMGLLAGLAVISLSLLFVMPAQEAARVWPWLGLATLWLGLRLTHPALVMMGVVLPLASALATLVFDEAMLFDVHQHGPWSAGIFAFTGLVSAFYLREEKTWPYPMPVLEQPWLRWGALAWALLWWCLVLPPSLREHLPTLQHVHGLVGWVTLSSLLLVALARLVTWRALGQVTWLTVPLWMLLTLVGPVLDGYAPLAHGGWLVWPLALIWHVVLLRQQPTWCSASAVRAWHVGGFWLFVSLMSKQCHQWGVDLAGLASAWSHLGWMLVPALALMGVSATTLQASWPMTTERNAYLTAACGPVAAALMLWLLGSSAQAGVAPPLPYVPVLNPLELGQACALLGLWLWFDALSSEIQALVPRSTLRAALGGLGLLLLTSMVLRINHHWGGVPWDEHAMSASNLAQTSVSVVWSLLGVGLMLAGHQRRERRVWVCGAGLLAVVVGKLFLIELADQGSLYRVVSFIVVGVLLLMVGYFAPMPPKQEAST